MDKIFKYSERLEKFQWNFQERCDDNIKIHKKTGLHPLSKGETFGQTTEGGQTDPHPAF